MLGGLIGGYCIGIYSYDSFSEEMLTSIISVFSSLCLFPGDMLIFGSLNEWVRNQYTTPPTIWKILIRCFLFNGGFGLAFGHLYKKYGIGYAVIAHGMAHLISDILMIIFV